MPSLKEIRGRIKAARNIQQITKAMKMTSAARLRRAQERMLAARPYASAVAAVLREIARRGSPEHPLLSPRPGLLSGTGPLHVAVIAADKGLCGAYNANILRRAVRLIRECQGKRELYLTAVGRKACDFFRHFGVAMTAQHVQVFADLKYPLAEVLARELMDSYLSGRCDEVALLFTDFRSTMSLKVTLQRLLPFDVETSEAFQEGDRREMSEYAFEPGRAEILDALVPRAVAMQVWRALLESQASEYAARMTAMDSATRNSKEMIDTLTLQANRIRQAGITKEIAELVGGAEALQ